MATFKIKFVETNGSYHAEILQDGVEIGRYSLTKNEKYIGKPTKLPLGVNMYVKGDELVHNDQPVLQGADIDFRFLFKSPKKDYIDEIEIKENGGAYIAKPKPKVIGEDDYRHLVDGGLAGIGVLADKHPISVYLEHDAGNEGFYYLVISGMLS